MTTLGAVTHFAAVEQSRASAANGPRTPGKAFETARTSTRDQAPKKSVLACCGGGLRGIIGAAMLERLEGLGRARYGADYRLSQSFDLVGGVSTGAVMATAVALGMRAERIVAFYRDDAPKVFRRNRFKIPGFRPLFDAEDLWGHYMGSTQGRRLDRTHLETDLAVMVKNMSDARPTLLTSMAEAGGTELLGASISAAPVCLADLLRASTAAPGLFAPMRLPIGDDGEMRVCVDGGIGPFNDPSHLLWALLTSEAVWGAGAEMSLVSLGAGGSTARYRDAALTRRPAGLLALTALKTMLTDGERYAEAQMQTLAAACPTLDYRKLDLDLSAEAIEELGLTVSKDQLRQMRDIADPRGTGLLYEAASALAEKIIQEPAPLRSSVEPARIAA